MKFIKVAGIAIGILLLLGAISQMSGKQPFKVQLRGVDLRITNIGDQPIDLVETVINERPECTPQGLVRVPDDAEQRKLKYESNPFARPTPDEYYHLDPGPYATQTLKTGDQAIRTSRCASVVKVRLRTSLGDFTYTF